MRGTKAKKIRKLASQLHLINDPNGIPTIYDDYACPKYGRLPHKENMPVNPLVKIKVGVPRTMKSCLRKTIKTIKQLSKHTK